MLQKKIQSNFEVRSVLLVMAICQKQELEGNFFRRFYFLETNLIISLVIKKAIKNEITLKIILTIIKLVLVKYG
jgi:hypothetical protein